jgi:hypothetical protein
MSESRRDFLATASMGLLGATISLHEDHAQSPTQQPTTPPAGAPPAFGTGPGAGPEVSTATFAEAEKLVQVELTAPTVRRRPEAGARPWPHSTNVAPVRAK